MSKILSFISSVCLFLIILIFFMKYHKEEREKIKRNNGVEINFEIGQDITKSKKTLIIEDIEIVEETEEIGNIYTEEDIEKIENEKIDEEGIIDFSTLEGDIETVFSRTTKGIVEIGIMLTKVEKVNEDDIVKIKEIMREIISDPIKENKNLKDVLKVFGGNKYIFFDKNFKTLFEINITKEIFVEKK